MPKLKTVVHSGTAQVFEGRPVPPQKVVREEELEISEAVIEEVEEDPGA